MNGLYTTCRCVHCAHLHLDTGRKMTCDAFPDGIPAYIINGKFDHRIPCKDKTGYAPSVHPSEHVQSGAA